MASIFSKCLKFVYSNAPLNRLRTLALRLDGNSVGNDVYLGPSLLMITDSKSKEVHVSVGDRVSIAPRVTVILVSGANKSKLSSMIPWKVGSVHLSDDCWIGTGVIIYPGVSIGKGAVVVSGSVVTKNVEAFNVVGGVPAKLIKVLEPF